MMEEERTFIGKVKVGKGDIVTITGDKHETLTTWLKRHAKFLKDKKTTVILKMIDEKIDKGRFYYPEKRRFERYNDTIPVKYRLLDDPENLIRFSMIKNIGARGICLKNETLTKDTLLKIRVGPPFLKNPVNITCKVVWHRYDVGLSFVNIPKSQKTQIIDYVNKMFDEKRSSSSASFKLGKELKEAEEEYRQGHFDCAFLLIERLIKEAEDKILNPLSVIKGAIQLLEKGLEPKNAKRGYFRKIHNSIDKIKKEVRTLRSF